MKTLLYFVAALSSVSSFGRTRPLFFCEAAADEGKLTFQLDVAKKTATVRVQDEVTGKIVFEDVQTGVGGVWDGHGHGLYTSPWVSFSYNAIFGRIADISLTVVATTARNLRQYSISCCEDLNDEHRVTCKENEK